MRRVSILAALLAAAMLARPQGLGTLPAYGLPVTQGFAAALAQESASADFNCDGKVDVVVLEAAFQQAATYPIRILGNNGTGGMADITAQVVTGAPPRVQWPRKMLVEDFNGDGRPDVLVADTGRDLTPFPGYQNQLLLSTSDCQLIDATGNVPQQSDLSHSAAAADIDGDGDLDLYIGNYFGGQQPQIGPQIWLNDGTGHFSIGGGRLPASVEDVSQDSVHQRRVCGRRHGRRPRPGARRRQLHADCGGAQRRLRPLHPASRRDPAEAVRPDRQRPGRAGSRHQSRRSHRSGVLGHQERSVYQGRWLQVLINNGNGTFRDETAARNPQSDNFNTWIIFVDLVDVDGDGNMDLVGKVPYVSNSAGYHRFELSDTVGNFTTSPLTSLDSDRRLAGVFSYVDVNNNGHRDFLSFGAVFTQLLPNTGPVLPPGRPLGIRASRNLSDPVRLSWKYALGCGAV